MKAIIVTRKIIASILSTLAISGAALAAIDRDDPANYGIGVLTCPYDKYGFTANCFVDLGWLPGAVSLYDAPSKQAAVTGTILHPRSGERGWQPFHFKEAGGAWVDLESVEIGYEENGIVVYETQADWFRTGRGWLFGPDLAVGKHTAYASWNTALSNQLGEVRDEDGFIGWFYPMTNQPLYTAPDGDEIGVFWDAAAWEASLLVLEQRGDWIQVLIDATGYPCSGDGLKPGGQTGWIRFTSDAGHPEIFWYTRGC